MSSTWYLELIFFQNIIITIIVIAFVTILSAGGQVLKSNVLPKRSKKRLLWNCLRRTLSMAASTDQRILLYYVYEAL